MGLVNGCLLRLLTIREEPRSLNEVPYKLWFFHRLLLRFITVLWGSRGVLWGYLRSLWAAGSLLTGGFQLILLYNVCWKVIKETLLDMVLNSWLENKFLLRLIASPQVILLGFIVLEAILQSLYFSFF